MTVDAWPMGASLLGPDLEQRRRVHRHVQANQGEKRRLESWLQSGDDVRHSASKVMPICSSLLAVCASGDEAAMCRPGPTLRVT